MIISQCDETFLGRNPAVYINYDPVVKVLLTGDGNRHIKIRHIKLDESVNRVVVEPIPCEVFYV